MLTGKPKIKVNEIENTRHLNMMGAGHLLKKNIGAVIPN